MESASPIPVPPAQRWREFRINRLPAIVFGALLSAVVVVWNLHVIPDRLTGEVESIQAQVSSPQAGSIGQLWVARLQDVREGDPVAQIVTTKPEIIEASLAVIRAEIDLIRAGMSAEIDQRDTVLRYEQLRLDWMQQRVDLAAAKVNLQRARNDARRNRLLFENNVVSEDALEAAETQRDALLAQVEQKNQLIQEIERSLEQMDLPEQLLSDESAENATLAAVKVQEENLRLTEARLKPVTLKAPLSGQVSAVHRQFGETVTPGDPIVTIHASQASKIIAYLPQPLQREPRVGMPVEVRTRSAGRQIGQSQILQVGAHLQTVTNRFLGLANAPQKGLPILVGLPPNLNPRPGELVDLRLLD